MGYDDDYDDDDHDGGGSLSEWAGASKSSGSHTLLIAAILGGTLLLCAMFLLVRFTRPELLGIDTSAPVNEKLDLDEANRLHEDGMLAYKAWQKARQNGDRIEEELQHRVAMETLGEAMDSLNRVLEAYRDSNGQLPDYEGYEEQLKTIAIYLGDLHKDAKVRLGDR